MSMTRQGLSFYSSRRFHLRLFLFPEIRDESSLHVVRRPPAAVLVPAVAHAHARLPSLPPQVLWPQEVKSDVRVFRRFQPAVRGPLVVFQGVQGLQQRGDSGKAHDRGPHVPQNLRLLLRVLRGLPVFLQVEGGHLVHGVSKRQGEPGLQQAGANGRPREESPEPPFLVLREAVRDRRPNARAVVDAGPCVARTRRCGQLWE
mmetsp:Transcript_10556/g.25742  ORF Transcript_10556/g.25742 Transcript_10556/m.25742 type:complete len:202 (+) Transcript_10556:189-794(+)